MHAPVITITIDTISAPARLCDTKPTRHIGAAGLPATSPCCCILIWHHRMPKITIGAAHLHQTYYLFPLTTWPLSAIANHSPLRLKPKHEQTVTPNALYRTKPAVIEIPRTLALKLLTSRYHTGPITHINPNNWPNIYINWRIPKRDAQITPRTRPQHQPTPPNDPQ